MKRQWLVLRPGRNLRWGGDVRRYYIFQSLIWAAGGVDANNWQADVVQDLLTANAAEGGRPRRYVAASEFLASDILDAVRAAGVPFVLDVHDDPLLQAEALGIALPQAQVAEVKASYAANLEAFRWHATPSARFARLIGLERNRTLIAPNGTDTRLIRPEPLPPQPTIGLVSGAAPNRGIENLVAAARMVRQEMAEVRLRLVLAGTGPQSTAYLDTLRETLAAAAAWVTITSAPYDQMSVEFGQATVICLPTPAHPYWDAVAPIKLFDALAAARPIVTTPRVEAAVLVHATGAGLVAGGDSPAELADALLRVLSDPGLAARMGSSGREAAERDHDWRAISYRLAHDVMRRARPWPLHLIPWGDGSPAARPE